MAIGKHGDLTNWARSLVARQQAVTRTSLERVGSVPQPAPQLVGPNGLPLRQVVPVGTVPWGVAPPGSSAPPASSGYAATRPVTQFVPIRSTVLMNKEDSRDPWADAIANLPELQIPGFSGDGGDALQGYYSPEAMLALRAAGSGRSGATHTAHTMVNGQSIGAQAIGDAPVPTGSLQGPAEYGQQAMPRGQVIPLRPRDLSPGTVQAHASPVAQQAPVDPILQAVGMVPEPPAPAPKPSAPVAPRDTAVVTTTGQLSLL